MIAGFQRRYDDVFSDPRMRFIPAIGVEAIVVSHRRFLHSVSPAFRQNTVSAMKMSVSIHEARQKADENAEVIINIVRFHLTSNTIARSLADD